MTNLPPELIPLARAVQASLSPDLLDPYWSDKHAHPDCDQMTGHCVVASSAFWYLSGGPDAGWRMQRLTSKEWPVLSPGESHYWVKHIPTGVVVDLTSSQFSIDVPYSKGRGGAPPTRGLDEDGRALPPVRAREVVSRVLSKEEGRIAAQSAKDWAYANSNEANVPMTDMKVIRATVQYVETPEFAVIDQLPPATHRKLMSLIGDKAIDITADSISVPLNQGPSVKVLLGTLGITVKDQSGDQPSEVSGFNVRQVKRIRYNRQHKELETIIDNARDGLISKNNIDKIKRLTGLDPTKQKDADKLRKSIVVSPPSGATAALDQQIRNRLGWW